MDEKETLESAVKRLVKCDPKDPCDCKNTCINHRLLGDLLSLLANKRKLLSEKEKEIEELKKEYEKLLNTKPLQPVVPLKYCKEHKTICMPFVGKLACCLEAKIKELEDGIEKHKHCPPLNIPRPFDNILFDWYTQRNEELYKLIEKK